MAMSKPVSAVGCEHESSEPLPLSPDTIQQLTNSWGKVQSMENGIFHAGVTMYKRLINEASPDELRRMNNYFLFLDTSIYPMKEHCCLMMSILDEIIVKKMYCINCLKELMRNIAHTHYLYGLTNQSELYRPIKVCIRWTLEELLKKEYSGTVKGAWDEFFECLESTVGEMEPNKAMKLY